jgi:hypothetical protein
LLCHTALIPHRSLRRPPSFLDSTDAVEELCHSSLASLSSPLSCAFSNRRPDPFPPQNCSVEASPERPDAFAASSHPSESPQEETIATDQAHELAVFFRSPFATRSPSPTTGATSPSTSRAASPENYLAGEPNFPSPFLSIRLRSDG